MTDDKTTNDKKADAGQKNGAEEKARFSEDSFWKDLAGDYFYPILKRALPELYNDADIQTKPRFLDKEFTDILKTTDFKEHKSPHFADFVIEVPLKDGSGKWVLLHFEQQSRGGSDLSERMKFYMCLVYAHYRREPAALAIITGNRPKGESSHYSHNHYGTEFVYKYNNLVLSELYDDELTSSDNPIDIVLYAAKCAAKSRKELQKYNYLRTVSGLLAERGWSTDDKHKLMLFMERIINLRDEALKDKYIKYQEQLDKEGKMMYVSIAEEYFTKKGREEGKIEGEIKGIEKGKVEVARRMLDRKMPISDIADITGLSEKDLLSL